MDVIVLFLFAISGLAIGIVIKIALFGTESSNSENNPSYNFDSEKNPTFNTTNHNYIVNNHLNITEKQLQELSKK